ncbi:MAG: ATP-grasp domain-containing protein [Armatimonadetes bacterium]|nr:ATP-grasp domain-containing protein [Armatimonadota bacterium]
MLILFPSNPLEPGRPDYDFEDEWAAAAEAGFEVGVVEVEELGADPQRAVRRIKDASSPLRSLYRGWMVSPELYSALWAALSTTRRGLLYPFGGGSAEGRKGSGPFSGPAWTRSGGRAGVSRVRRVEPIGVHPQSGMPLSLEYRLLYLYGQLLGSELYWEEAAYPDLQPPLEHFGRIAGQIPSPFFTMDVARGRDEKWWVVELGDGQVAGLPAGVPPAEFYARLAKSFQRIRAC